MTRPDVHERLLGTLKRAAAALKSREVSFALTGGCAAYARGAGMPVHDVDFMVPAEDVEPAVAALLAAGMHRVEAPEDWLVKVYDGDQCIDLIHRTVHRPVTAELLARAESIEVAAMMMPVLDATDLVISFLLPLGEHHCDFGALLRSVRPMREQVDWKRVHAETVDSPYAYAFLTLLFRLRIIDQFELQDRERRA
jgi:Uncharacterised nucleotidyltransferase